MLAAVSIQEEHSILRKESSIWTLVELLFIRLLDQKCLCAAGQADHFVWDRIDLSSFKPSKDFVHVSLTSESKIMCCCFYVYHAFRVFNTK